MRQNTHSGLLNAQAECMDCEFRQFGRNAMGLAAQHADRNPDHMVRAEQTIGVTYNRKEEPESSSLIPTALRGSRELPD